jgi:hypothetical protein
MALRVFALVLSGLAAGGCRGSTEPSPAIPPTETSPAIPATLEPLTPLAIAGTVATVATPSPSVRVKDQSGRPLAGVQLRFDPGASGVIQTVLTDDAGVATFAWQLGTRSGSYIGTVSSPGLPSLVFTADAAPGPVASIRRLGSFPRAPAGATLGEPISVTVADGFKNAIVDVPVTFAVLTGGGVIDGGEARTDTLGVAVSGFWTLGPTVGEQLARVTAGTIEIKIPAIACEDLCDSAPEIAFVRERRIFQVNSDGTGLVQVTSGASDDSPAWSPDGRSIAFVRKQGSSGTDIFRMDPLGGHLTRLTNTGWNQDPTWSPDGQYIAFSGRCSNQCIAVMSADGATGTRLIGNPDGHSVSPAWSPDGRSIAFVSDRAAYDFYLDIYVTDPSGSSTSQLTPAFDPWHYFLHPAWSPDGLRIAFVYGKRINQGDMRFTVATMHRDGTDIRDVAWAGDIPWRELLDPGSLSWSPDGRRIAFTFVDCNLLTGGACTGTRSIRYASLDGQQVGTIVTNGSNPSWRR